MKKNGSLSRIAVFCGSRSGSTPLYAEAAKKLAEVFAALNITLVYGGAKVGVMGVLADHLLGQQGSVIGVIPQSLVAVEVAHGGLTELHVVESMHARKALIEELSDAFILLPGGMGSLDEFFEILTWAQLGYHQKPCGILNVNNYYDAILEFIDHAVKQGFLDKIYQDMIVVDASPLALISRFKTYQPPISKWTAKELKP